MSVSKINTNADDLSQTMQEMGKDVDAINDAVDGLRALAMLLHGYQDDTVGTSQVMRLLDPIVANLQNAAEQAEVRSRSARRAMNGERPLPGENDLYLCRLSKEYQEICEANTGIVSDDESAIMDKMLATPADSIIGVAAKLAAVSRTRDPEPTAVCDKLEHRALVEVERLGGFAPESRDKAA
ncbi:hypothetical protein CKO28_09830 [Rhodovibrio sodomensis]|uniref:Chemotaxis protein CheZ n=1 Tax=Rhodovibrio sodomensis TaxID=1088 RepID=A0ABS1DF03_9PROT|nr:hypothetical protein [Rhodovibrio sodomensis]MBK1668333.1 hypothetical protein [Rhodovibrio sodomensis]